MSTLILTEAELRAEYGDAAVTSLADRNGDGSADSGVVEDAIQDAEDEALSYLRSLAAEDLPTTPTEATRYIKVLVGNIAWYNLYKARQARPFSVRDGYDQAIARLELIRDRKVSAQLIAGASTRDAARPTVTTSGRSQFDEVPLTLESMRDWGHYVP